MYLLKVMRKHTCCRMCKDTFMLFSLFWQIHQLMRMQIHRLVKYQRQLYVETFIIFQSRYIFKSNETSCIQVKFVATTLNASYSSDLLLLCFPSCVYKNLDQRLEYLLCFSINILCDKFLAMFMPWCLSCSLVFITSIYVHCSLKVCLHFPFHSRHICLQLCHYHAVNFFPARVHDIRK